MRLGSSVRRIALAVTLAVTVSACSSATQDYGPGPHDPNLFTDALQQAKDYGASENQIDVLTKAAEDGVLTYDDFLPLIEDSFTCLEDAGFSYELLEPREEYPGSGFLIPDYTIGAPLGLTEEQEVDIMNTCRLTYEEFANSVYQLQPAAIEATERAFAAERPQVVQCLRDHGVDVPDDATFDEIRMDAEAVLSASHGVSAPVYCMSGM